MTDPSTRRVRELGIELDSSRPDPVYRQIVNHIWEAVVSGALETGERLPTIRQLAIELGIHPDTVTRAYEELQLLGVVVTRRGEGTFIGLKQPQKAELERRATLEQLCLDFMSRAEEHGFTEAEVLDMLRQLPQQRDPPSHERDAS